MNFLMLIMALLTSFSCMASAPARVDICSEWNNAGEGVIVCENNTNKAVSLRYRGGNIVVTVSKNTTIMIPRSGFLVDQAADPCEGIEMCEQQEDGSFAPLVQPSKFNIFANRCILRPYDANHDVAYCQIWNDTGIFVHVVTMQDDKFYFSIARCAPGVRIAIPNKMLKEEIHFEIPHEPVRGYDKQSNSKKCDQAMRGAVCFYRAFIRTGTEYFDGPSLDLVDRDTLEPIE